MVHVAYTYSHLCLVVAHSQHIITEELGQFSESSSLCWIDDRQRPLW